IMDSGAVHDACMIASHAATGMIFVPSINGRSHVPEEDTKEEDLICGCQFLLDTIIDELK
ncbi:MAG: M20/M25/M40 family metallo-hydrolase, partial [Anaerovoracaceae bacterium]